MLTKDIHKLSALKIAEFVNSGRITAVEIAETTLCRIEAIDPQINAFATVDVDGALSTAKEIDARIGTGDNTLPLAGVPFSVKDLIPTKGVETAYGSHTMEGNVPNSDVTAVEQLKNAGGGIDRQNDNAGVRLRRDYG